MLKKLALDKTQKYEKCIAKEHIAKMLVEYVRGDPHILGIGAEQGDIPTWDDFVIENQDSSKTYIQVKRQTTSFGQQSDKVVREKDTNGKLRKLSEFDKVFEALAKVTEDNIHNKDSFWIYLPDSGVHIKKELVIRQFRNTRDGITDITSGKELQGQSEKDAQVKFVYSWLTSWCGFNDWEHIVKAMKLLTINVVGFESDIESHIKEKLGEIFKDEYINTVYSLIGDYLEVNSTYSGAFRPRDLLIRFHQYLKPDLERWTLFKADGSCWMISGINDMEQNSSCVKPDIERASRVVEVLWKNQYKYKSCLRFTGTFPETCKVTKSLMRLSLHSNNSTYIPQYDLWINMIKKFTGGTLGVSKDDFQSLNFIEMKNMENLGTECLELSGIHERENYARELNNSMHLDVLKKVHIKICDKINEMDSTDLRDRIEECWNAWKKDFEEKDAVRNEYFSSLLHPRSEGDSISGELRVGCKTVTIIAEAVFLTMVISVVFNDKGIYDWTRLNSNMRIRTIALQFWSGSSGSSKKVLEIDDENEILHLLEQEKEEVIILSGSKESVDNLLGVDLTDKSLHNGLLSDYKCPQLVVPYNRIVKRLIKQGDVSTIKDYLQSQINEYKWKTEESINKIIE